MFIVDRRLNPGSKSLENRQRFLCRAKALVQGAGKKTFEGRDQGCPGGRRGFNPAGMESTNRMTLSCRILQGASLLKSRAARNWRWDISNDLLLASLSTASDIGILDAALLTNRKFNKQARYQMS
jgi:hypothetical protein